MRPTSSVPRNWPRPSSGSPTRWSSATHTSSKNSSRVSRPFQPMPRIFGPIVKPGVSFSTTKLAYFARPAARRAGLGAGQQRDAERHVGAGVGDERLAAVDQPAAVLALGPGRDAAGVGAGVGLGEPERAEDATLGERPQPALALRRRCRTGSSGSEPMVTWACNAAATDWSAWPSCSMRGDEPDGRHPDAAPLLGDEHAEQAELAHLAQEIGRAVLPLPGRRRADRDLLRGELPTQVDQVPLGFGEREVHAPRLLDRSVQPRKWSRCRAERDICSIFGGVGWISRGVSCTRRPRRGDRRGPCTSTRR